MLSVVTVYKTQRGFDSSCTNGIWYGILKLSLAVKQQIFNFVTVYLTLLLLPPPPAVESGATVVAIVVGYCRGGLWVGVAHGWEGFMGGSGVVEWFMGGRGLVEWLMGGRGVVEWLGGGRG